MDSSPQKLRRLFGILDNVERVVVHVGRCALVVVMAAVLAVVGIVIARPPWTGNQGEWFYFGIAVLLALGWAIGQYRVLGRRLENRRSEMTLESALVSALGGAQRSWGFRFGTGTDVDDAAATEQAGQFRAAAKFEVPFASILGRMVPDEAMLQLVEDEIERGATLDEACRVVQPELDDWSGVPRRAYTLLVASLLEGRQAGSAGRV